MLLTAVYVAPPQATWLKPTLSECTGLLQMIVGVLTTCRTQYTWDRSMCTFYLIEQHSKFLLHTLQVLYICTLCDPTNINTTIEYVSTQNDFSLRFVAILVNCAPSGEMHNYCTPYIIKENSENFLIHRNNYIFLSQMHCVWQVVKTPTVIFNNPVQNANICCGLFLTGFPTYDFRQYLLSNLGVTPLIKT
jgi:hypothetical protein